MFPTCDTQGPGCHACLRSDCYIYLDTSVARLMHDRPCLYSRLFQSGGNAQYLTSQSHYDRTYAGSLLTCGRRAAGYVYRRLHCA